MRINTFTTSKNSLIGINAHKVHNNYHKRHKAEYIITACIPKITIKKKLLFFSSSIRMSTSIINFNDKKIKKTDF